MAHPSALLLRSVGVAVEAGEDGAGGHQLAGVVPAASVAEARRIPLALHVQDGVQSDTNRAGDGELGEHFYNYRTSGRLLMNAFRFEFISLSIKKIINMTMTRKAPKNIMHYYYYIHYLYIYIFFLHFMN